MAWWKSLNPRAGLFVGLHLFCGFNWFLIRCHSQPGGVILEGRGWWMGYQRDAVENDYVLRSRDSSCISAAAQTGKWQIYQIVGKDEIINLKIFAFGEEPTTVHIFYTSTLENTPKETLNKSTMILINESDSLLFLPLIIKVKTVKTWWISFPTSTLKIPLISLSPIKFSELFKKYQISCRELGCHLSFNSKALCNPIFIKTDSKGMRGIFKLGMFWQGTSDFFCVINLGLSVVGLHILSRSFPAANSAFSCQVFDKMLKKRPN